MSLREHRRAQLSVLKKHLWRTSADAAQWVKWNENSGKLHAASFFFHAKNSLKKNIVSELLIGVNANITLQIKEAMSVFGQGQFSWTLSLPFAMVVQNGCLICLPHRQQLMSSLSVSLSSNRCLTNETKITKTTIYQSNNRCQSIADQSGWVGSCCCIFS